MYEVGDTVKGKGVVEANRCGFTWPVDFHGHQFCGVVIVKPKNVKRLPQHPSLVQETVGRLWCDAMSGEVLSREDLEIRKNNYDFDYEDRYRYPKKKKIGFLSKIFG